MGFFGSDTQTFGVKKSGLELNLTNILILVVTSLVVFQAIGLVFGKAFGFEVNLGPVFILLSIGISSLAAYAFALKFIKGTQVTKKDIFAITIVAMLTLLILFFLRDFVPEIFAESLVSLQSMVKLG